MQITKNRIRRDYQPLSVAVSVAVGTAGDSPLTQVWDDAQGVYQPNRELTPLVLRPTVVLTATDGSLASPLTNRDIAADTMKWVLDGKDITTVSGWSDKASVAKTADDNRGLLTLTRNVSPGESHTLYFECYVADTRTGKNIHIVSDSLILSTTDKSEDGWAVGIIGNAPNVTYDPVTDSLAEMEYEMAQGIATHTSAEIEAARKSADSYVQEWVLDIKRGRSVALADIYDVRYWHYVGSVRTQLTDVNMAETPVTEMDKRHIRIDMRTVKNMTIDIEVVYNGSVVAETQVCAARVNAATSWDYLNKTGAMAGENMRDDRVLARTKFGALRHPQRTHNILWYITDASGNDHQTDFGEKTRYSLKQFGLTDTKEIAEAVATEPKPAYMIATDKQGKILTDGQGRAYIFTGLFNT